MTRELTISLGQHSDKGRKEVNQDFHGALTPEGQALAMKGITVALTDGISSSSVSQIAAESTIKSFLMDYYCTSDAWSVKTSALRVIKANNSWLYAETKRSQHAYDMDKGYVCTLCAMVLKSHNAHIFHVGDSRIYRVSGDSLEQLTSDHRTVVSSEESYLARAIGMAQDVDIDYRKIDLSEGDIFVLATDGVFEFSSPQTITRLIHSHLQDLDEAARLIVADALEQGSADNLTLQIVRIDTLPLGNVQEFISGNENLPTPKIRPTCNDL
jgi:serine/threonine protein phosphatase PrpC